MEVTPLLQPSPLLVHLLIPSYQKNVILPQLLSILFVSLFGCYLNQLKLFTKHFNRCQLMYLLYLQAAEFILLCVTSSTWSSPVPKHFTHLWYAKFLHSDWAHRMPKKVNGIHESINKAIKLLFYGLLHSLCFSTQPKKMPHRREHIQNDNSSSRCFYCRSL